MVTIGNPTRPVLLLRCGWKRFRLSFPKVYAGRLATERLVGTLPFLLGLPN
jgi:hypothetical protein